MRAIPGRARWTRSRLQKSLQENFRTIISSGVCAKSTDIHIYSQMNYVHNFLENFIRFYCTTLYFYCLKIYLLQTLCYIMFRTCNLFFVIFFNLKVLRKTSCYSAVDIVVLVMVYDYW